MDYTVIVYSNSVGFGIAYLRMVGDARALFSG